jgi:hypothetical protein
MAKAQMAAQPDNIMMLMMLVLPVATEVCAPVLAKFGFAADQGGLMVGGLHSCCIQLIHRLHSC